MRLTPLESVLNRNIAASSAARALCKRIEGKVLALHVEGAPISVYFAAHGERMTLDTRHEGSPTATLSGTPLSLLRLAGPKPETVLRARSVHIEGDAEAAYAFSELLKAARPDLEEELSRVIGDVAAHQVGNVARSALRFCAPRRRHLCSERRGVSAGGRPRPAEPHGSRRVHRRRRRSARQRRSREARIDLLRAVEVNP